MNQKSKDNGASIVEYVLLVSLVALVCIAGITILGTSTGGNLSESGSSLLAP